MTIPHCTLKINIQNESEVYSQYEWARLWYVYLFAAYRNGVELWYIDKRNMIFRVNGKDYMADVRKALGYS